MFRSKRAAILGIIVAFLIVACFPAGQAGAAYGQRITISGTKFYTGSQEIWMNGVNTPWNSWNDFGGSFSYTWWDTHFQQLKDNGINSTRVWISCNGEVGININSAGQVSGATTAHWNDLDSLFQIAQNRGIYIMATLLSFDHTADYHGNYQSWRNMIGSNANIDSYVNNYVIPFVNRYKNNPYLWSIDLMNEPDWSFETHGISWDRLQTLFAKMNVAIHQNSSILTTVGMSMVKYNSSSCTGCQGNMISDSALQSKVNNNQLAKVDFWSVHYYDWMGQYWGVPMYLTPAQYGMPTDRPNMLGEMPGNGTTGNTTTQDVLAAYNNGWRGTMPWTSNGVDGYGSLTQISPATNAFRNQYPSLVYPTGDAAQYNFESGTQSFTGTTGLTVSSSTDRAFAGTRSLKVSLSVGSAANHYAKLSNPSGLSAGKTVTFRIWVPSGANLAHVQPYVMDTNWSWTGNLQTYASLTKNAWNTINVTIPSGATGPFKEIGVEVRNSGSYNGSVYIDSITWP
jgi:hypothetical protein